MPLPKDQAWFPAKTYGYGWGIPCRWQGWLVMLGYMAALFTGTALIKVNAAYFVGYVLAISTVLIAICRWKGQAARWRWGDDEK